MCGDMLLCCKKDFFLDSFSCENSGTFNNHDNFYCSVLIASKCTASPHLVTNSERVVPPAGGQTAVEFSLSCSNGYTPSERTGRMVCVNNIWTNRPKCQGLYFILENQNITVINREN